MCILCHQLVGEDDWTDAALGSEAHRAARDRRRQVVDAVLRCYGLRFRDDPVASIGMISDGKGRAEVASGLAEIWPAASRLASGVIDPLDPALLKQLDGDDDQ